MSWLLSCALWLVVPMPDPLPVGKLHSRLLAEILTDLPTDPSVLVGPGIGCDVAVIDAGGPSLLLAKSDPITFATDEIGFYAVAVNTNDIATAGGRPRYFLATALLPENETSPDLVAAIVSQLALACDELDVALVGGHTEVTAGLVRPIIAGTMLGEVPRSRLVTNAGTQVGDAILLTKTLAIEGTSVIAREKRQELLSAGFAPHWLDECAQMLHSPGICVLPESRAILSAALPHAMHDPTEGGLATALWEMAAAAGVGIELFRDAVPICDHTAVLCRHFGLDPMGVLASGSLLVALAESEAHAAIRSCRDQGIPCVRIGRATHPSAGVVTVSDGVASPLPRFDQDELTRIL